MRQAHQSTPLSPGLGIPMADWQRTPLTVRDALLALLNRVDALEARHNRDFSNPSHQPSTDAPTKKRKRRTNAAERRTPGAQPGHPNHRQVLLELKTTISLFPEPCGCGQSRVSNPTAYQTHQVSELPIGVMWRKRSQGICSEKGNLWVERVLSFRQTCRIRGRPTFPLLVEAVRCRFKGETPDVRWITHHELMLSCATP
jgi:hypothetical protein